MSYTLVLEWMPGDLYMSAVTARCTAPTSSYSVVWLPPNKVYQITLYCGSTSLVSFLVGAFRGKAWSYMKNKIYIIDGKTYLSHINDEVHLYGLLHQLAFLAGRIKDEEDVFHVLDAAKRYGEIAEEKFQSWGIPGRYLVFGDPKDLKGLMDKELDEVEAVPEEEPKPKKYKDEYIIPGYGFRMLVGDIHHLIVLYYSLARRLSEAETEKDFLRLKKKAGGYEKVLKKLYRSLGLPEDSNAAQDVLEESIIRRHNLVRLEDMEEPQDEGDLEGDEVWSD